MKYMRIQIVFCLMLAVFCSCEFESDEIKLTGDISQYVPSYSVGIECTMISAPDGTDFFQANLIERADFDLWGLSIKKVDLYVDEQLIGTSTSSPFTFNKEYKNFASGKHEALALVTVGGENCNDVTLESKKEFICTKYSSTSVTYIYNYVTKGDYLYAEPIITNSSYQIDNVEYKWDNNVIATNSHSPFNLNYLVNDEIGTTHSLEINVKYHSSTSTRTSSYSNETYKILGDDDIVRDAILMTSTHVYKNGDVLKAYIQSYEGKNRNETSSLKLKIDGKELTTVKSFPVVYEYTINGLQRGIHMISFEWSIYNKETGQLKTTDTKTDYIVITK